jgi:hypothetical protein
VIPSLRFPAGSVQLNGRLQLVEIADSEHQDPVDPMVNCRVCRGSLPDDQMPLSNQHEFRVVHVVLLSGIGHDPEWPEKVSFEPEP